MFIMLANFHLEKIYNLDNFRSYLQQKRVAENI